MIASIMAGTSVQFEINGSTGEWIPRTEDDVRSMAVRSLSQYGVVTSLTIVRQSSRMLAPFWDWRYRADLRMTTKYGHAKIEDLNAIVRAAFWDATGEPPTVTSPTYGQIQGTGVEDESPDPTNKLLGFGAVTIVAAVAVAVFVLKRG